MPQDYSQFQGEDYAYTPQGPQQPNLFEGIVSAMEGFRAAREGRMEKARVAAERSEAKRLMLEDRELKRRGQEADIDYKKAQKDALLGKGTGTGGTGSGKGKDAKAPASSKRAQDLYDKMMKYRFDILGDKPVNDPMDFRDPEEKAAAFAAEKQARMESLLKDPAYIDIQSQYAAELDKRKSMGGMLNREEERFIKSFYRDGFVDPEEMEESMGSGEAKPTEQEAVPEKKDLGALLQNRPTLNDPSKKMPTTGGDTTLVGGNKLLIESLFGKQEGFQDQTPSPKQGPLRPKMLSQSIAEAESTVGAATDKALGKAGEFFGEFGKQGSEVLSEMKRGFGELVQVLKGNPGYVNKMVKDNISPSEKNGIKNVLGNPEDNTKAIMELADTIDEQLESPYLTKEGVAAVLELSGRGGAEKLDLETRPELDSRGRTAEDRSGKRSFYKGGNVVRRSRDARGNLIVPKDYQMPVIRSEAMDRILNRGEGSASDKLAKEMIERNDIEALEALLENPPEPLSPEVEEEVKKIIGRKADHGTLFGAKGQNKPNVDIRQGKTLNVEALPNRR